MTRSRDRLPHQTLSCSNTFQISRSGRVHHQLWPHSGTPLFWTPSGPIKRSQLRGVLVSGVIVYASRSKLSNVRVLLTHFNVVSYWRIWPHFQKWPCRGVPLYYWDSMTSLTPPTLTPPYPLFIEHWSIWWHWSLCDYGQPWYDAEWSIKAAVWGLVHRQEEWSHHCRLLRWRHTG